MYCLTLWNAWRWTGDDSLIEVHWKLPYGRCGGAMSSAIGTGTAFQEYATRSPLDNSTIRNDSERTPNDGSRERVSRLA